MRVIFVLPKIEGARKVSFQILVCIVRKICEVRAQYFGWTIDYIPSGNYPSFKHNMLILLSLPRSYVLQSTIAFITFI